MFDRLLVSCEHGGNRIPRRYAKCFESRRRVLEGHRGYDLGALPLARRLARSFDASLHASTTSRLLADLNRSATHPACLSEFVADLSRDERLRVLERYHRPHRERIAFEIARSAARGERLLHIAVHTFTPVLRGRVRRADVGLLYDPKRRAERHLCARWKRILEDLAPDLRVRRNFPYRGDSDGLTTHLRRQFSEESYAGIELEASQRLVRDGERAEALLRDLEGSLARLLRETGGPRIVRAIEPSRGTAEAPRLGATPRIASLRETPGARSRPRKPKKPRRPRRL